MEATTERFELTISRLQIKGHQTFYVCRNKRYVKTLIRDVDTVPSLELDRSGRHKM